MINTYTNAPRRHPVKRPAPWFGRMVLQETQLNPIMEEAIITETAEIMVVVITETAESKEAMNLHRSNMDM